MALTQKEISARNYRNRKDNGLCPRCGKPLDREGHYCSSCLEKHRIYCQENRKFFRENHLCTQCGKNAVPNEEKICPECRARLQNKQKSLSEEQKMRYRKNFRENQRKLYLQRSQAGICTRCGKRKAKPGRKKCELCLSKDAEIRRRRRDLSNTREFRKQNHLCYFCGGEIDLLDGNMCSKCKEHFVENGKKYGGKNEYWKQENKLIFGGKTV